MKQYYQIINKRVQKNLLSSNTLLIEPNDKNDSNLNISQDQSSSEEKSVDKKVKQEFNFYKTTNKIPNAFNIKDLSKEDPIQKDDNSIIVIPSYMLRRDTNTKIEKNPIISKRFSHCLSNERQNKNEKEELDELDTNVYWISHRDISLLNKIKKDIQAKFNENDSNFIFTSIKKIYISTLSFNNSLKETVKIRKSRQNTFKLSTKRLGSSKTLNNTKLDE